MAATADQIAKVRRLTAETSTDTYADADIQGYIEAYPLIDERGEAPYSWDTTTEPPTQEDNDDWIPTYDLNQAAADIWQEKAGQLAGDFDFQADGASYTRSQAYQQAMQQARHFRSRRSLRTFAMRPEPFRSESRDASN
jgi:hypothetical protein